MVKNTRKNKCRFWVFLIFGSCLTYVDLRRKTHRQQIRGFYKVPKNPKIDHCHIGYSFGQVWSIQKCQKSNCQKDAFFPLSFFIKNWQIWGLWYLKGKRVFIFRDWNCYREKYKILKMCSNLRAITEDGFCQKNRKHGNKCNQIYP